MPYNSYYAYVSLMCLCVDNGGIWSQQQKLRAVEFINYYKTGILQEVQQFTHFIWIFYKNKHHQYNQIFIFILILLYIAHSQGLDLTLGQRVLGPEVGLNEESLVLGVTNQDPSCKETLNYMIHYST